MGSISFIRISSCWSIWDSKTKLPQKAVENQGKTLPPPLWGQPWGQILNLISNRKEQLQYCRFFLEILLRDNEYGIIMLYIKDSDIISFADQYLGKTETKPTAMNHGSCFTSLYQSCFRLLRQFIFPLLFICR